MTGVEIVAAIVSVLTILLAFLKRKDAIKFKELELECKSNTDEREKVKEELRTLKIKIHKLETENDRLTNELTRVEKKVFDLLSENHDLNEKYNRLRETLPPGRWSK